MAGKVTLTEVKTGVATLDDLLKLNALIDAEMDHQHAADLAARNNPPGNT